MISSLTNQDLKDEANQKRLIDIFENLNNSSGMLDALFTFGNTLELLYLGGMVHPLTTGKERSMHSLIPLYVEFKSKKCH